MRGGSTVITKGTYIKKYSNELRISDVFNHFCSGLEPNCVEGQLFVNKRNSLFFSNHIHRPYSLNYSLSLGSFLEKEEQFREKVTSKSSSQQLDNNKSFSISVSGSMPCSLSLSHTHPHSQYVFLWMSQCLSLSLSLLVCLYVLCCCCVIWFEQHGCLPELNAIIILAVAVVSRSLAHSAAWAAAIGFASARRAVILLLCHSFLFLSFRSFALDSSKNSGRAIVEQNCNHHCTI